MRFPPRLHRARRDGHRTGGREFDDHGDVGLRLPRHHADGQGPGAAGEPDWTHESGAYLGAWASNVDFGPGTKSDFELDVLGGFRGKINDDTTFDVGAVYYGYPGGDDFEYPEVYAGIGYKMFSGKIWYSWDFGNSGEDEIYLDANLAVPLPNDFGLALHAGYTDSDYFSADGGNYFDYLGRRPRRSASSVPALKWIDGSDLKSTGTARRQRVQLREQGGVQRRDDAALEGLSQRPPRRLLPAIWWTPSPLAGSGRRRRASALSVTRRSRTASTLSSSTSPGARESRRHDETVAGRVFACTAGGTDDAHAARQHVAELVRSHARHPAGGAGPATRVELAGRNR
ncbi:MAG: TorF family putative porin [Steroidobacteraceae bacterium]